MEGISARVEYAEGVEEVEGLIPILEKKYNLTVSDSDQLQTNRASLDLRNYNIYCYTSLVAYYTKRCFYKKKGTIVVIKDDVCTYQLTLTYIIYCYQLEASKEIADLL